MSTLCTLIEDMNITEQNKEDEYKETAEAYTNAFEELNNIHYAVV